MCGTRFVKKPSGPISFMPAITTAPRVIIASTKVTLMLPVAEAPPGIIPSRLQKSTKKKIVQRNGRKPSAWCPPIAGRAIWSRMNTRIDSKMFRNGPLVTSRFAMCRASGTKIAISSSAAIASMTMKRVTWSPSDDRQLEIADAAGSPASGDR